MIALAQHLAAHQYTDTCDGWESCDCGWREEQERRSESGSVFTHAEHVAVTWQQARTITDKAGLDALPIGSIVRDSRGDVDRKGGQCTWEVVGARVQYDLDEVAADLPALVLWTPADGGDQ